MVLTLDVGNFGKPRKMPSYSLIPGRPSFFSLPVRKSGTPGNTSHVHDIRFNERGHG